jgi:hypothetical protein
MDQDRFAAGPRTTRRAAGPPRPLRAVPGSLHGPTLALTALLAWPAAGLAQTEVFRCASPDGTVEFRQHACAPEDAATRVEIEDRRTGWTPPSGDAVSRPDRPAGRERQRSDDRAGANEDRNADRCWSKRQQLERVNNELRAGYTPGRGERLKTRRREYEAYLSRYCR